MSEKRRKIWIHRFQTSLSLRISLYFILYQFTVWSLVLLERNIVDGMDELLGPAAAAYCFFFLAGTVVLLGILFIYDAIVATHRVVGPLYRLRQTIKAVTAGEEISPVAFRKDDYLLELRDDFNEMLRALEQRGAITLKGGAAKEQPKQPVAV